MYLLDANTYIEAKNRYYQMSFCPAYWNWLDQQYQLGTLTSITSVYDELAKGNDELADWVRSRKNQFADTTDETVQSKFSKVAQYVDGLPNKNRGDIDSFLDNADPWLVAFASTAGKTVVTQEARVGANSKKIKLPNICERFKAPYISTFELLNELDARFLLADT